MLDMTDGQLNCNNPHLTFPARSAGMSLKMRSRIINGNKGKHGNFVDTRIDDYIEMCKFNKINRKVVKEWIDPTDENWKCQKYSDGTIRRVRVDAK